MQNETGSLRREWMNRRTAALIVTSVHSLSCFLWGQMISHQSTVADLRSWLDARLGRKDKRRQDSASLNGSLS
jgi:hypothetical protein